MGVAFDKLYGDVFPAISFYNSGQSVQIVSSEIRSAKSTQGRFGLSPFGASGLHKIAVIQELQHYFYWNKLGRYLSYEIAELICNDCNRWCNSQVYVLSRTVTQQDIYLSQRSPLLDHVDLRIGDRVRTSYGMGEVAGVAFQRIWFCFGNGKEVWYFTVQQILEGKLRKFFIRSTYQQLISCQIEDGSFTFNDLTNLPYHHLPNKFEYEDAYIAKYDVDTVIEMLDQKKWTNEMDLVLLNFLLRLSEANNVDPAQVSIEMVLNNFRTVQFQLTRIVLSNSELSFYWGISGPKRRATIARLSLLRIFNQYIASYLPLLISDPWSCQFEGNKPSILDDFTTQTESFWTKIENRLISTPSESHFYENTFMELNTNDLNEFWPPTFYSWDAETLRSCRIQELWLCPFHTSVIRQKIIATTKLYFLSTMLKKTATLPSRTEDEYDYPDNLPQVKINRLKALRVREACELLEISSDDIIFHTLFCQLWKELRQFNFERLRLSYQVSVLFLYNSSIFVV